MPVQKILGHLGSPFSLPRLISATGKSLLLPFYHVVSNEHLPHLANLYRYRNELEFEQDLDFLLKHFAPIALNRLLDGGFETNHITKPSFHLTFDDGLRECAEVIAPVLLRKGIPATFFVNSGFIDNRGLFYRYKVSLIIEHIRTNELSTTELAALRKALPQGARHLHDAASVIKFLLSLGYEHQFVINQIAEIFELDFGNFLRDQKPYMSKKQVQKLVQSGFTIGAHSIDHPLYSKLEIIEQLEQTVESVHYVSEVYQVPYRVFAFPFTDDGVGRKFFSEAYETGHTLMELSFGTAGLKRDVHPRHLQRVAMEGTYQTAEEAVRGAYINSLLQQATGTNRIKRK